MADDWEAVLDRLEAEVRDLESQPSGIPNPDEPAALGGQPATWTPPNGLGPLPDHLADRAHALAAAQTRTALRLEEIRASAVDHLAALRTIPLAKQDGPVYLDVEG